MKLALGYSLDVSVEKPLNHKLRVTVRVDVEPGRAPEAGVDLSFYLEGTLDPVSTVAAMSDENLAELTDALYRHLDTRKPLFGAHTWYDFAADELQHRHAEDSDAPPQDELALG
jgi:hypothetical protein